jgi:hypothetical protein
MMLKKFTPYDSKFSAPNASPSQEAITFYVPQSIPKVSTKCITQIPYQPFTVPSPCTIPKILVRLLGQDVKF